MIETTALIVPAAGSGTRLGMGRPKALIDVGGLALVRRTLMRFVRVSEIVEALVVAPGGFIPDIQQALVGLDWPGCEVRVIAGGDSRQESVRLGIEALLSPVETVCIHDAARPLVSQATIQAVLAAARAMGAAIAASRPADSVREDTADGKTRPLDRSRLWLVETPQAFATDLLRRAHDRARATGVVATDDASLVESCCGQAVRIVESEGLNVKVTRADDLKLVRRILER